MSTQESDAARIFLDAVENCEPDQRPVFINDACGANPQLRARVFELLKAHEEPNSLLDDGHAIATLELPPLEKPGLQIGPYKLLQQIGEGGFGVVFLAEQERPVKRRVALKVIKPGMDTREVIARFEAERQALAMMDHPNIAKVYDAGTTGAPLSPGIEPPASSLQSPASRPFFVMELVQGVPITEYCDQCNLTTHERLELFVTVCQAVQHAHQKGVIHRDIKPTNVLLAIQDGTPTPKIIDFGVAKAINQQLTERTLMTAYAQIIGTPLYMSPEQAELSPLGVDTRSDIYSLGVLLYELLAGTTPFDKARLHAASYDELRRIIHEEEPPRPSARLSSLSRSGEPGRTPSGSLPLAGRAGEGETAQHIDTIAEHRRTDPRRLVQLVRGELDWIVMKCLEKDRSRRYESAGNLSQDIERYLHDEPVQAGPPSTAYRFRKFARRNKAALTTAALLCVVLLVGAVISAWQAVRATRAERAAATEAQKAKTEAAIAQAINEFLNQDLLAQAMPEFVPYDRYTEPTVDLKLLTVLDRAAERLEGRFADQPLVEAALRHTIGHAYGNLGNDNRGALHMQRAVELREAHLGEEHSDTLTSMMYLAWMKYDPDEMTWVVESQRRVLGKDHRDTLSSMFALAMVTGVKGEQTGDNRFIARSIELYREALVAQRSALGEDDTLTAWTKFVLANTLATNAGKDGIPEVDDREIEAMFQQALAVRRNYDRYATWQTFDITKRFGQFLSSRQRYEEAEALLQDALERIQSLPGAPPELAATFALELDAVYQNWGKPERADQWKRRAEYTEAIRLRPNEHGPHYGLGSIYAFSGQWAKAAATFERAAELSPADLWSSYRWATLCFYANDHEGYRRACRAMLDHFGETDSLLIADCTAKACSLGPESASDAEQIMKLADFIVTNTEQEPARKWYEITKGLVDYRAERFGPAAEIILRSAPSNEGLHRDALAFSILAMAQHRLGKAEEANSALAEAQRILLTKMPKTEKGEAFGDDWHDWLHSQILFREAEELLQETEAETTKKSD